MSRAVMSSVCRDNGSSACRVALKAIDGGRHTFFRAEVGMGCRSWILGPKVVGALVVLAAPITALAQQKLHIELESAATRVAWVADQPGPAPDNATKFDGKSADITAGSIHPNCFLEVIDSSTGNLALKKVADPSKAILVKDADFNLIGHVQVQVEHNSAPVSVASVQLNGSQAQLIDPSSQGIADFYAVKPGNLQLAITYHSGSISKVQKQAFTEDLQRDQPVPLLLVSITSPVDTVAAAGQNAAAPISAPANASAKTSQSPPTPARGGLAEVVLYIGVVLFVALVFYGGFTWLRNNQQKTQDVLQKVGVKLQDPVHIDPTIVGGPLTPAAPQPQQQIILSDAAPTPLLSPGAPVFAAPPSSGQPRVVRENGQAFDLLEGISVVGRDAGMTISLAGESSVSRHHAEISRQGDQVFVKDLGSTNGTFVNGHKIDAQTALKSGDTVQFGMVRFRYEG